jgi:peptide/nickel transport system permease protein
VEDEMSVETPAVGLPPEAVGKPEDSAPLTTPKKSHESIWLRVTKYTLVKTVMLFFTVAIAVYLTILIANMGGYVDQIMKSQIRENIMVALGGDRNYQLLLPAEKEAYVANKIRLQEERLGLDRPFVERSFGYLFNALRMELGRSQHISSDTGSKEVRNIILERLAPTLLLLGAANFILFFGSIWFALVLSRSYGSFWDRMVIALSPTSSAPAWFYGLFLILIFAAVFKVLPFGGMIDTPPPDTQLEYAFSLIKHLILPTSALVLSSAFVSIYNWRTFFLIYSSEDYVEMAKAKGLSDRDVQNRYILRPTLPNIITNFAFLLITLWTGAILTEAVFNWPGLGGTYITAIGLYDTGVIVGLTIIYAYMLALTVFILDIIYALVDPRVKVGSGA